MTPNGAESLRKNFRRQKHLCQSCEEKELLVKKVEEISLSFEAEVGVLEEKQSLFSQKTKDGSPVNVKCPVANKPVDATNRKF